MPPVVPTDPSPERPDVAWTAPGYKPTPSEALARIEALCALAPDLYAALWVVAATHARVPRELLVPAVRQFRADAQAHSAEDLLGMLTAICNVSRQAYDAVLRTRRQGQRKAAAGGLPWVSA